MPLPNDPFILLSVINTKLRDFYPSLAELCSSEDISCEELETALAQVGYRYSAQHNQFIR
ncbi:MAG: DUF4250 domain-containing protein [Oscillospiraceae bacterium]